MAAVILAAGRGRRLLTDGESKPKVLTSVGGESLLSRHLRILRSIGETELHLVAGYRADTLQDRGFVHHTNDNWETTNTVRSLLCVDHILRSVPCIVLYGDCLFESQGLATFLHAARQFDISVASFADWRAHWSDRYQDPVSDLESFRVNELGELSEIGRRVESLEAIQGQFMGLLALTPEGWESIRSVLNSLPSDTIDRLSTTELLQSVLERGKTAIHVERYAALWGEIDTLNDLAYYRALFKTT